MRLALIPWEVDIHTHLAILNDHVRNTMAHHFPNRARPNKEWVSEQSWEMICGRREANRVVATRPARTRRRALAKIWEAWRAVKQSAGRTGEGPFGQQGLDR